MNITKEDIKNTPAFNKLDSLQQSLVLKKDNFERIRNGVSVVGYKGLEGYKKDHNPSKRELTIITELLLNASNEVH